MTTTSKHSGIRTKNTRKQVRHKTRRSGIKKLDSESRLLLEVVDAGIAIIDKDWKYIVVNDALSKMLRIPKRDLLGHKITELLPGVRDSAWFPVASRVMETRKPATITNEYVSSDGHRQIFENRLLPFAKGIMSVSVDITDRVTAVELLSENEERYRTLFENTLDAILLTKPDGTIIAANPAACGILQRTENELCQLGRQGLVVADQSLKTALEERAKTGRFKGELNFRRKDGTVFPAEVTTSIFRNRGGQESTSMVIRDVSERKHAEEMIRASEERYRKLFESSVNGIDFCNMKGRYVDANDAYTRMLGFTRQELTKLTYRDLTPSKWHEMEDVIFKNQIVKRGYSDPFEKELIKKDGTKIEVRVRSWRIDDDEGKPVGAWSITEDITERMKAAEAVRRERDRAQTYLDVAGVIIVALDAEGKVMLLNRKGCEILECSAEEAIGKNWFDHFIPSGTRDNVKAAFQSMMIGKLELEYFENLVVTSTGKKSLIAWHNTVLKNAEGRITGSLSSGSDITERRQIEERLRVSELRFGSLFDRMLDGVYRSTHGGRFVDVNPAFVRMFGYSSKQEMLAIPDIKRALYFSVEERGSHVLDTGKEEVEVYRMRRKDGSEIWVEDHGHYVHDDQGRIIYHEGLLRDVTERLTAERALSESEERYKLLFERSPVGVGLSTVDGRPISANKAMLEITGYSLEELRRINLTDTYLDSQARTELLQLLDREGSVTNFSARLKRKDGTFYDALLSISPLHVGGKDLLQTVCVDISQQMQMEENLRRRAEELVALQSTVLEIIQRRELSSMLHSIVERAAGLLHAPSGGLYICDSELRVAQCVVSYNTSIDYSGTVLKFGEGAAGHVAETGESLIINDYRAWSGRAGVFEKDQPFRALLSVPMTWEGRVIGVIHVLDRELRRFIEADLNLLTLFANHAAIAIENERFSENLERMVAERTAKLAETQNQLQVIADSLPAVIGYVDSKQRYKFNNKTYEEWFGQSRNAIVGRHVREVLGEEAYEKIHGHMEAALAGVLQSFEYEFALGSSTRHISATYIPDFGEHGQVKGVFVLGIDITERRRMEERLLKAERLAAIGETAAMVGHDLRNPLQAISTAAYVLKKNLPLAADEQVRKMLEAITNSVNYSDRIVDDLLTYSQDLRLEMSETTPKILATNALLQLVIPKNIVVSNSTSDDLKIRVDADKIGRLFMNVIQNAIDAMPNGGEFTISSNMSSSDVVVKFTDTGEGIPENVLREIWKPLLTTKSKGIGLGLAICKRIAEAHGGSISVDSKIGEGTAFTLRLPTSHQNGVN